MPETTIRHTIDGLEVEIKNDDGSKRKPSELDAALLIQLSDLSNLELRIWRQVLARPDGLGQIVGSRLLVRLVDAHRALEAAGEEARLW